PGWRRTTPQRSHGLYPVPDIGYTWIGDHVKTLGRVDDLARLRERALALIRGFAVGDALGWDDVDESARIGSAGRAALGIARHVARLGRVDERALHRSILDGEAPLHVSDPSDTWIESRI